VHIKILQSNLAGRRRRSISLAPCLLASFARARAMRRELPSSGRRRVMGVHVSLAGAVSGRRPVGFADDASRDAVTAGEPRGRPRAPLRREGSSPAGL
jgi:hypothetical protein